MANFSAFPFKSYWFVGSDETQVYSTADRAYVPIDNAGYAASVARGEPPHRVETEQDLWDYLNGRVLFGTPDTAYSTDTAKQSRIEEQVTEIVFQIAFNLENRMRTLEAHSPLTLLTRDEFLVYIKTLMK